MPTITLPQHPTFTHTPRPAITPADARHAWQRRFGASDKSLGYKLKPAGREAASMNAELEVFRDASCDLAEVRIALGLFTAAQITARLTADELRDLAARLIDAAHDIDTLPAAVLARAQEGGAA